MLTWWLLIDDVTELVFVAKDVGSGGLDDADELSGRVVFGSTEVVGFSDVPTSTMVCEDGVALLEMIVGT